MHGRMNEARILTGMIRMLRNRLLSARARRRVSFEDYIQSLRGTCSPLSLNQVQARANHAPVSPRLVSTVSITGAAGPYARVEISLT